MSDSHYYREKRRNVMNPPQTVKELNAAIIRSFNVLEGSRAYEVFPLAIQAQGQEFNVSHRVVMLTLALKGLEDLCCEQIWNALISSVPNEEVLEDCSAMLFVRRWFSWDEEDKTASGRVGFYNDHYQQSLLDDRAYTKEGFEINRVINKRK